MRRRTVGRTIYTLVVVMVVALCAASCGSSNGSEFDGGTKSSESFDATASFLDAPAISPSGDSGGPGNLGNTGTPCTKATCQSKSCGMNSDGCGGLMDCGMTCTAPDFCGGGGPNLCGNGIGDGGLDGGSSCVPAASCASLGFNCGYAGDHCGGLLDCGGPTCPAGQSCGIGQANVCGTAGTVSPDGSIETACVPTSCAGMGVGCGPSGDGCGKQIDCGSCTSPETCGGIVPSQCGNPAFLPDGGTKIPACVPSTCASLGYSCGPTGDGCGNAIDCGTCPSGQTCSGTPGRCGSSGPTADGASPCTPLTCTDLGYGCGVTGDGCGGQLNCGTCTAPDICGGGGVSYQCGHCTGLCQYQLACDGGTPTTITGTVRAAISAWLNPNPNSITYPADPVPNVLVYVPSSPLSPITSGYPTGSCPACGADVSGNPLVSTYTNFDGTFSLANVPVPPSTDGGVPQIPVVIQLGRWRREVMIPISTPCGMNAVGDIHFPRNKTDGLNVNIPLTAISTGNVDALECVLLKMGVDQAEFTSDTSTGRIHVYGGSALVDTNGNGAGPGAVVTGSDPESTLVDAPNARIPNYDQVMFPCWGTPAKKTAAELAALSSYADSGGHFFATHFSWSWLYNNGEFANVATWDLPKGTDADNPGSVNWTLNVSKTPPMASAPMHSGIFYQWLNLVGALSNSSGDPAAPPVAPQVSINNPRFSVSAVQNGSVDWIDGKDQSDGGQAGKALVEHLTFNTPVTTDGGGGQCGHGIFSDFHVTNGATTHNVAFPTECLVQGKPAPFTAQERILEYMIFDLASCVTPSTPSCTPLTCATQNISCGPAGDGCGQPLDCGSCAAPETCGGGGVRGVCGVSDSGSCVPQLCPASIQCGPWGNGCGGLITSCGTCPPGETCGGGGTNGQCGAPDAGACVKQACPSNIHCGPAGDGCGGLITSCGTCPSGETCGGPGVSGTCVKADSGTCVPQSCPTNGQCGPQGDGCGNRIDCGCPTGQTCGGAGVAGHCGVPPTCTPFTCAALGYNCGPQGDGCGGALQCGTCTAPLSCGGGGAAGVCGEGTGPK